jgi:FlaG/FlaF family flagellin (archaellin)
VKPKILSGRKAISPGFATITLVAVTLVIAVSFVFYYTSVVGAYSSFEEVELKSLNVHHVDNLKWPTDNVFKGSGWNVSITLKNTGTRQAIMTSVLLNGRPLDAYERVAVFDGTNYVKTSEVSITIMSGNCIQLFIAIKNGEDKSSGTVFSPGSNIEVTLQSTSGTTYMRLITLT